MTDQLTERGIVLSTSNLGEYDKRLVILTENLGKITVFANGARKQNSRFGAASQVFTMGKFMLYPGRNTYTLHGAEIEKSFLALSGDMEQYAAASYVCELTEYFAQDGLPGKDLLNLLYVTFQQFLSGTMSPDTVRAAFILKLLHVEGVAPDMELPEGVESDRLEKLWLDPEEGHLTADPVGVGRPLVMSSTAIYAFQYIYSRPIAATYSFKISDRASDELLYLAEKLVEHHLDRPLRSARIIQGMRAFRKNS